VTSERATGCGHFGNEGRLKVNAGLPVTRQQQARPSSELPFTASLIDLVTGFIIIPKAIYRVRLIIMAFPLPQTPDLSVVFSTVQV
jgi:hypothetical protein